MHFFWGSGMKKTFLPTFFLFFCLFPLFSLANIYMKSSGNLIILTSSPISGSKMVMKTYNIPPPLPYNSFLYPKNKKVYHKSYIEKFVKKYSKEFQVPKSLINSVIKAESGYDPYAVSDKGAMGLMQLMPATAARFGVTKPFDPRQNIKGGVAYLQHLMQEFHGNLALVVAGYNAGGGAVRNYGGIPPFQQTQQYVQEVLTSYKEHPSKSKKVFLPAVYQVSPGLPAQSQGVPVHTVPYHPVYHPVGPKIVEIHWDN